MASMINSSVSSFLIRRGILANNSSVILRAKILAIAPPSRCPRLFFSTAANESISRGQNDNDNNSKPWRHPQSFVQSEIPLEPGEKLPPNFQQMLSDKPRHANDGKDAYWRPPWKNRAEIISAEDFANRPRVSFSDRFANMHDAMVVLTWMTQEEKDGIYQLYLDMMSAMATKDKNDAKPREKEEGTGIFDDLASANTSHEYVVRVVAQHYNVSTSRAAGVIQLQHNEEQLKKQKDYKVMHDLQEIMDAKFREHIREVYKTYGETDPLRFVEDPLASTGLLGREDSGSTNVVSASDLVDIDALVKKAKKLEEDDARARMENHIYVEDVDERTKKVEVDHETNKLLKKGQELGALYDGTKQDNGSDAKTTSLPTKFPSESFPYPDNNRGFKSTPKTRRPRWKYAAQIINTYKLEHPTKAASTGRKVAARAKKRRHGRVVEGNTLIEEGGTLRVASVAELEQTSWKHVRNESEIMFRGVKEAWLRRQLEGEVGGWGRQEEINEIIEEEKAEDDQEEGDVDEGDDLGNEEANEGETK